MAYVIAEPCVATCDLSCTRACPVDCIHGPVPTAEIETTPPEQRATRYPKLQLYIDPSQCICCGACEPECPVQAIFDEEALPPQWASYREANARFFRP